MLHAERGHRRWRRVGGGMYVDAYFHSPRWIESHGVRLRNPTGR